MARSFYGTTTQEKAVALAARSEKWSKGTARTPRGELVAVNCFASESQDGKVWLTRVDGLSCNCPGAQRTMRGICFHMVACQLVTQRVRDAAAADGGRRCSHSGHP